MAGETVTDYIIKADTAATALRNAGETVSNGLFIAMTVKGLPEDYRPFVAIITQKDDEFKFMLRSFAETKKTDRLIVMTV